MSDDGPIELEPTAASTAEAAPDARARVPEPLPVRLVAVADVRLPATAGLEPQLDAFYVGLLGFEREGAVKQEPRLVEPLLGGERAGVTPPPVAPGIRNQPEPPPMIEPVWAAARGAGAGRTMPGPVYVADNFRLIFEVVEGRIVRDDLRPVGIEVPSLAEAEAKLIEAEMKYTRQRVLQPGQESLAMLDPTGNWIEITEMKTVS